MSNPEIYKHGLGRPGNEEYDRSVREKLKGSGSPKRVIAQQIRRLRESTSEDDTKKRLIELVRNPEVSALRIQEVIEELLEKGTLTDRTKTELIGKMVQAHTAIHGAKQKNLNINVDVKLEDVMKQWKERKKKAMKIET